jgi:hypothetical protein
MLQAEALRGDLLPPLGGAAVMIGYTVFFSLLAARVTLRADVT